MKLLRVIRNVLRKIFVIHWEDDTKMRDEVFKQACKEYSEKFPEKPASYTGLKNYIVDNGDRIARDLGFPFTR